VELKIIGIDLAKESFQLHGVDSKGKAVLKKTLKRKDFLPFFANLTCATIYIEACGGSNYWARKLIQLGHQVRVISAQYVKPFLKNQKNDANDAEAIVEAGSRPAMQFVSHKEIWQQDIQSLHRIRQRLQDSKVALINQARSLLLEYGLDIPQSVTQFRKNVPIILEDASNELTDLMRATVWDLYEEYLLIEKRKEKYDVELEKISKTNEVCKRLQAVPGIGPLTATAFVASVGDPSHFKNGRQTAAWLGLVPRQHSTGGKTRLFGITKRGDVYLRSLLVHGGRSVVSNIKRMKVKNTRQEWIEKMLDKKGVNTTAIAIANHNVRVMWAMMTSGANYKAM
jgi:transposase